MIYTSPGAESKVPAVGSLRHEENRSGGEKTKMRNPLENFSPSESFAPSNFCFRIATHAANSAAIGYYVSLNVTG